MIRNVCGDEREDTTYLPTQSYGLFLSVLGLFLMTYLCIYLSFCLELHGFASVGFLFYFFLLLACHLEFFSPPLPSLFPFRYQ